MANAYKDENGVSTIIGRYFSGGSYLINRALASPSTNRLSVNDGTTGNFPATINAGKDDNDVSVILAVSSVDGQTPVEVYVDNNGYLLVQST